MTAQHATLNVKARVLKVTSFSASTAALLATAIQTWLLARTEETILFVLYTSTDDIGTPDHSALVGYTEA